MKLTAPRDVLAALTGWVAATARPARNPLAPVPAGMMLTATADGTLAVAGTGYQAGRAPAPAMAARLTGGRCES